MSVLFIESVFRHIMNDFELRNLHRSVIEYDFFLVGTCRKKMAFPFAFVTVLLKGGATIVGTRPHGCTLQ